MENCPSYANSYTPPDSESVASNSKKTILSTVTGDGSSVQTASECYEDRTLEVPAARFCISGEICISGRNSGRYIKLFLFFIYQYYLKPTRLY